jgi:hypothetical protein
MIDPESSIIQRYFRKTPMNPDGAVTHHGDCDIFSIKICNCGLMHDLMPVPDFLVEKLYPAHWAEREDYGEVREMVMHKPRKAKKRKE